jgi:WD40 repeat protein
VGVLDRFTRDRLLTAGDGTVEVAHEALIGEWPRLRAWLDEDVQGREIRAHITQAAKQWAERDRDRAELYRGTRLSITLEWAARHGRELNELEREFLSSSREASEQEVERQRRTNRRLRGLLVGTAIFLVVALVAGSLALVQRGRARRAQAAAEAQALTSDAERLGTLALTEPNLDRSLLLAVAGVQLRDLPETRGDLLNVLQSNPALLRVIQTSPSAVNSIAVSPDGRLLASGDSAGVVSFHSLQTWQPTGKVVQLAGSVTQQALTFSPDGATLAAATATGGDTANVYLIDVASRTATKVASRPSIPASAGPPRFTHMAFSPDGTRIAVAVATSTVPLPIPVGERLLLFDAKSESVLWEREYPLGEAVNEASVAFTPGGVLVTSAQNGEMLLWDVRTGRVERRFPFGGPFALSPDGHLAAVARNNANPADPSARLALLDLRTGEHRYLEDLPSSAWIIGLAFTPDSASVVGTDFGGGLNVWDLASGEIVQSFAGGLNVAVTPDGRTVLSEGVAWDISGEQRLGRTFAWHAPDLGCATTPCFVISPDGRLMAEDLSDGTVALVELDTRRLVGTLPARSGTATDALAFVPEGRTLVTGGANGTVTFWDVDTRSVVRTYRFPDRVWSVGVSPDGEFLAVQTAPPDGSSSFVEVRDFESGDVLFRKTVPNGKGGLEFSSDGRVLAALGCCEAGSTIEVWDARSGEELFSPRVEGDATSIAFSPDGLLAAGTEDGAVVLWDARDGSVVANSIQVATGSIDPISFSPDGRWFVASSVDQTTTLWDVRSHKRLGAAFPVEQGSVPVARFASEGTLVIENLADTAIWPTDLSTWVGFACEVAGRELTRAEWGELLPDRPYRPVCPT